MSKDEAIQLFLDVQNGRGTGDLRDEFVRRLNARGRCAVHYWNDGVFTYGIEYGILITLMLAFDLHPEDLGWAERQPDLSPEA